MRVILRLHLIDFVDTPAASEQWWRNDPGLFGRVWRCLDRDDLLSDFRYVARPGTVRPVSLESTERLAEQATSWRSGNGWLSPARAPDPGCFLDFGLLKGGLGLRLGFGGASLDRRRTVLLDRYVDAVRCLHADLHTVAVFGPILRVEVIELPYPRPRPPRLHQHFGHGDAIDFFCLDFHRRHPSGRPDEVARLLTAPLPASATRQDDDDLVIVRWVDSLHDEAELARRLSAQDRWLTGILQPPIAPQFDEHGDRRTRSLPPPQDTLLSFYEAETGTGYVEPRAGPGEAASTTRLDDAVRWLADRRLPDGRPLNALYVVAPDRERALQIGPRARAGGAAGVYYVGQDGSWWDPFPPGPWIEEAETP